MMNKLFTIQNKVYIVRVILFMLRALPLDYGVYLGYKYKNEKING